MKKLITVTITAAIAFNIYAQEEGSSCETAYDYDNIVNSALQLEEQQERFYINFTANNSSIAVDLLDSGGELDEFDSFSLYSLEEGCESKTLISSSNLTRYFENGAQPYYYFQLDNLAINSTYLLVIERDEAFELAENDVLFNSIFFATNNCTSQSGCNLVRNGTFEDFNVSTPSPRSQFIHARDQVCWWKE